MHLREELKPVPDMTDKERQVAERKALIISAAVSCFIGKGYNQSGVRDIAKKAGISLGNLYNHFSGKHAVLAEIAALESQELKAFEAMLADHRDPLTTLEQFAGAYLDYASLPENAFLGLEIIGEAVRNPIVAEAFSANRAALQTSLADLLAAGVEAGQMRAFPDPMEPVRLLLDMIEGQGLRRALGPTEVQATAKASLLIFVRAAVAV